jgi:hypothetical protein
MIFTIKAIWGGRPYNVYLDQRTKAYVALENNAEDTPVELAGADVGVAVDDITEQFVRANRRPPEFVVRPVARRARVFARSGA